MRKTSDKSDIHPVTRAVLLSLDMYKIFISPLFPASCRFHPSCSVYWTQAIKKYGLVKGIILGIKRLLRCHPWNPGGFDPVP